MYMSRFGVKNYKCLGEIDIPLTPIHVLIGENDAGKTSLLEAMAALFGSAELGLQDAFPRPWEGRELVRHASPEPDADFCGEWKAHSAGGAAVSERGIRYGFIVRFPLAGMNCTTQEDWIDDGRKKQSVAAGGHPQPALKRFRDGAPLPQAYSGELTLLLKHIKRAHHYAFDAKAMAVPAAIDPGRKFRLGPDGFGLPTLLDDMLGRDSTIFQRLRDDFCNYFHQFKNIRIESEHAIRRHYQSDREYTTDRAVGKAIYFETRDGQAIRAQQASDGAILFLGFLALAHLPEPPTLLLIEEPENGIYPKRLGEVITLLKQMVQRTEGVRFPQIIMSTHSPYVLSHFEPEEVTFLSRPRDDPNGPVRARPLRDAPNIRERMAGGEFYLGELWYNLTEEELFGEI